MRFAEREDRRFILPAVLEGLALTVLTAYLFYNSPWGLLAFPALLAVRWGMNKKRYEARRRQLRRRDFQEAVSHMAGSLNAGYSLEQAVLKCAEQPWGRELSSELVRLRSGLESRKAPEELFFDWGNRWRVEEMLEFSNLLRLAKRHGGNLPKLIRQFTKNIYEMEAVDMEIATMVAAKKLEGRIMLAVPFGILLYMRASNLEIVEWLYTGVVGRAFMTVGLALELAAACMIEKIVRIEV